MTPADAIVHAAKELTEALKGNKPGALGDTYLYELARVEQIFAQKSQSYKAMSNVVEQTPRVREETATPPRVDINKAMSKVVEQPPRVREEAATPPRVDCDKIAEVPTFRKQEYEADMPARNTRSQRRTLTQEVIYSCMNITYTPVTPRNLASRKVPMKLLCEISGAL